MRVFPKVSELKVYLVMYTNGICLFFGLSAISSLRSNLKASRKLRLISSSLYPLSADLNLSRDASMLSGYSFARILEIHGSFYECREY